MVLAIITESLLAWEDVKGNVNGRVLASMLSSPLHCAEYEYATSRRLDHGDIFV
jgi:hypothetical protein